MDAQPFDPNKPKNVTHTFDMLKYLMDGYATGLVKELHYTADGMTGTFVYRGREYTVKIVAGEEVEEKQ